MISGKIKKTALVLEHQSGENRTSLPGRYSLRPIQIIPPPGRLGKSYPGGVFMLCVKCKSPLPEEALYCPACGKKQTRTAGSKPRKRANSMGTAYRLKGKRKRPWVAARRKAIIGYYETKTEALEALAALEGKKLPDWYNITLGDVFERWKAQAWPELAEKSQTMYENSYKKLEPLQKKKMRDIRASDYQAIIDGMEGKSRSLKNQVRVLCSQLCKWAQTNDIISRNYAESLNIGRSEKKEKEIFSADERKIIKAAAASDSTARIVMILIYSGLRINELFEIKKTDVHLDGDTPHMIGGEKTEAGKDRMIPIALPVLPYIQQLMQEPGLYLVCNSQGGRKSYHNFREREYYPLLGRLKLPRRTLHTTRHTFASMMVEAGARPEDLQKILGHADYSVTANIYNHANAQQLTKAIRLLG